jgi:hypothetical protein
MQPFQQGLGPRGRASSALTTIDIVTEMDPCVSGDVYVLVQAVSSHIVLL